MPDVVGTDPGNTPFLTLPRVKVVFLRPRPPVAGEIRSICRSSTKRSARSFKVHRGRPVGGVVQAKATSKAACLPVKAVGEPDRACSLNAAVNPSSTNRWRGRCPVESPRWSISAISSSVAPSATCSNTWARATRRAVVLPLWITSSRDTCSSLVRSTNYLWAMGIPPVGPTMGYPPLPVKTFAAAH